MEATEKVDGEMRLEWNLKKGETFASTPGQRKKCEGVRANVNPAGKVLHSFELLGTAIHLHGMNRCPGATERGGTGSH